MLAPTAQAESSSLVNDYLLSIFLSVSELGRIEAGYQQQNGGLCVGPVQNEVSVITEAVEGVPQKVHDDPHSITLITL